MSGPIEGGRRRIDRVLADDFLDGVEQADLDALRSLRHEADQEDADLSYIRRLLQGRIDIVQAEVARRASGGEGASLVDQLATILADDSRSTHGSGRHLTVEPSRVDEHRRAVEQVVADAVLSDVGARSDAELAEALEKLRTFEAEVSTLRRQVQVVADKLTAELGGRYRDGSASIADALSSDA
jgi:DNA repair exonuclease SbcCD nuclease subunit